MKKKAGFLLLALTVISWIATPVLPFLNLPAKSWLVFGTFVIGELCFVGALALLGREYWEKLKAGFRKMVATFRSNNE